MKIVLANGCFDLFHIAHLRHLQQARSMGDILIVGLTTDEGVNKGAGRPIIPFEERRELLLGLRCVSAVIPCNDSMQALRIVKPHVFCKGADYIKKGLLPEELDYCSKHGIEIRHTDENKQTTTAILEKIKCMS